LEEKCHVEKDKKRAWKKVTVSSKAWQEAKKKRYHLDQERSREIQIRQDKGLKKKIMSIKTGQ
jgi:hypothetical protein